MPATLRLIERIAPPLGAVGGAVIGRREGGLVGAAFGCAAGLMAGYFLGRVPFMVGYVWLRRSLRRSTVAELRARLRRDYSISHLVIAELLARGQELGSLRSNVAAQLESASPAVRRFGRVNAQMWFPELLENDPPEGADAGQ